MRYPVNLEDFGSGYKALRCPNCDECYLHQSDVAVFNRDEDADQVRVTTVRHDGVDEAIISEDLSLNPSPRRYGLRISFWCEHCDGGPDEDTTKKVPDLAIYQHKGQTFIEWVD